uniref:Uncharacterized protein n=1 Tax=Aegilops tauschii subsp. strangulata TaxID=200361 RepID=A0A453DHY7_AEGTS
QRSPSGVAADPLQDTPSPPPRSERTPRSRASSSSAFTADLPSPMLHARPPRPPASDGLRSPTRAGRRPNDSPPPSGSSLGLTYCGSELRWILCRWPICNFPVCVFCSSLAQCGRCWF